jgi:hypothetical protein
MGTDCIKPCLQRAAGWCEAVREVHEIAPEQAAEPNVSK